MADFSSLKAIFINCSIKKDSSDSHTQKLMNRAAGVMQEEGVEVEHIYMLDHSVAFGMIMDGAESGLTDDFPTLYKKIINADILVIGSPIWLGAMSSVTAQLIERMYAYSAETNDKDQYVYYGKVAGCITTGNEDGGKAVARDVLYAMQHIGYTIPPQADTTWLGEAGPGPSYGDEEWDGETLDTPAGYDNDFTNTNTTIMAWNLMHMAKLLKNNGGIPAEGNTTNKKKNIANAGSQNPEYR